MTADPSPLGRLLDLTGTWRGRGTGVYPTIESFEYLEEITVSRMPKPVLRYEQRTRRAGDDEPLHAELGWFRAPDGVPELVIAQPTGITEVHRGEWAEDRLSLASTSVGMTPSAASHRVTDVRRIIRLDGDALSYELHMAAVGQPLQLHLRATLTREA